MLHMKMVVDFGLSWIRSLSCRPCLSSNIYRGTCKLKDKVTYYLINDPSVLVRALLYREYVRVAVSLT